MTGTLGPDPSGFFNLLDDGSLELILEDACIQTTAKRAHRAITIALIEDRASEAVVGPVLEMLESFLRGTDFGVLRSAHPELAGGVRCRVRLFRQADGTILECLDVHQGREGTLEKRPMGPDGDPS